MRLTALGNRRALVAALASALLAAGCRRTPYIDPTKVVPHDPTSLVAKEDAEVQQAQLLETGAPVQLPKMSDPRTTANPEAEETWELTLEEAIKIGLDNAEVVRVIPLGAAGTPVGGFEPQFLAVSNINTLGAGNLVTVYDPAIVETRIASALSQFDANLSTTLFWGRSTQPFNNAIQTGFFAIGERFPVISTTDTAQMQAILQKRTANGSTVAVQHNINYQYQNSPVNVFPSAYTTNLQFRFSQPLLGSAPTSQFNPQPLPSGLEANRAPIVIARLRADFSVWQFKAQVMGLVRSIEQQYWALAQASVQYWAAETAVDLGEKILDRERARFEVGTGSIPNVAEAEEQLERFRLDFVNRTAELVTTERQLRNLLGLPPSDNRRIVPVTAPTDAFIQPNWQATIAEMLNFQPDIVQGQLLVRVAELQLLVARNQLLPVLNLDALYQFNGLGHHLDQAESVMTGRTIRAVDPIIQNQQRNAGLNPIPGLFNNFQSWQVGFTFQMPLGYRGPMADVRQAQYLLLQQRAYVQQLVHQTSHQLARFFLEVDVNYKLFKTASRLKAAAKQRLEAQKAFYENGTITIDRYLDAVNRWANAVVQEADFRTRYNTSIILLEELKGTLLAYNNIAVAEGPWPAKAYIQAHDQRAAHRTYPVGDDGNYLPRPITGPPLVDPIPVQPPPNVEEEPVPPLPFPGGPFGPPSTPSPPSVPAAEPPVLSNNGSPSSTGPSEPNVVPTAGEAPSSPSPTPLEPPAGPNAPPTEVPIELPPSPPDLPELPEPK
jgi:outer membrane protein TolC